MATIGGRGVMVVAVLLAAGLWACDGGSDAGAAGGAGGSAAGGAGGSAAGGAGGSAAGGAGGVAVGLSQAEIDALLFTREEEKLARDVYDALDGFGQPFTNIQASEQSHMDALLALIVTYGLVDPAEGRAPGSFANEELQALYDALVAQGSPGAIEALQVGCAIEELDLRDIELAQEDVTHEDLRAAYDTLLFGSRNHLRAFYGRLQGLGGTYTPQYVSQAHFDEIVSSPHERP